MKNERRDSISNEISDFDDPFAIPPPPLSFSERVDFRPYFERGGIKGLALNSILSSKGLAILLKYVEDPENNKTVGDRISALNSRSGVVGNNPIKIDLEKSEYLLDKPQSQPGEE